MDCRFTGCFSKSSSNIAKKFCSFVSRNDLTQHVKFPTHTKGYVLDLIFSNFHPFSAFKEGDMGLSDHTALTFVFPSFLPQITSCVSRTTWNLFDFNKLQISDIHDHMVQLHEQLRVLEASSTTGLLWNVFWQSVVNIAKTHIPERNLKAEKCCLSREAKTVCRKKKILFRTWKSYLTPYNVDQLKTIGNFSRRLMQTDYKAFIDSHISDNLKMGNSKPLLQLLARSTKGNKTSNITQLRNCETNSDMAVSFAKF